MLKELLEVLAGTALKGCF